MEFTSVSQSALKNTGVPRHINCPSLLQTLEFPHYPKKSSTQIKQVNKIYGGVPYRGTLYYDFIYSLSITCKNNELILRISHTKNDKKKFFVDKFPSFYRFFYIVILTFVKDIDNKSILFTRKYHKSFISTRLQSINLLINQINFDQ